MCGAVHAPCAEQPLGHAAREQSAAPQPARHSHVPGAVHAPRPSASPQTSAPQSGSAQPLPFHPARHVHSSDAVHAPWPPQPPLHAACAQLGLGLGLEG